MKVKGIILYTFTFRPSKRKCAMQCTMYMVAYTTYIVHCTVKSGQEERESGSGCDSKGNFLGYYFQGLRIAVLLGSFGTAVGSWIKVLSASPGLFWVAFCGQTIVAMSQIFILGIPPLLAAVWFGPDQVSTATSIGVFGNQVR